MAKHNRQIVSALCKLQGQTQDLINAINSIIPPVDVELLPVRLNSTDECVYIRAVQIGNNRSYVRVDTGAVVQDSDFRPIKESTANTYELVCHTEDISAVGDCSDVRTVFAQYQVDPDGNRTLMRYYQDDRVTPTSIVPARLDSCTDDQGNTNFVRFDLTEGTCWTVPAGIQSFTIIYDTIGNPANPATITTFADPSDATTAITSTLLDREIAGVSIEHDTVQLQPGIEICSNLGDRVKIMYTHYTN